MYKHVHLLMVWNVTGHKPAPVIVHDGVESTGNSDDSALTELTADDFLNEGNSF